MSTEQALGVLSPTLLPRYIRFVDEEGRVCYGRATDQTDQQAFLLKGDLFGEFEVTKEVRQVSKLLAPIQPTTIIGIGLNYRQHANELSLSSPVYPIVFYKNVQSLQNPNDPIWIPPVCYDKQPQVDYEVELAVVIGKHCKDVSEIEALNYVLGYTIGNDVSARWWQANGGGGQWCFGKSFDSFCPLGPALILGKDLPNPNNLQLSTHLNRVLVQNSNTSDMIFSVEKIIHHLSQGTTLLPGTVILTGTPHGVGSARKPPVFLANGDVVELRIDHIGLLKNPVKAQPRAAKF